MEIQGIKISEYVKINKLEYIGLILIDNNSRKEYLYKTKDDKEIYFDKNRWNIKI